MSKQPDAAEPEYIRPWQRSCMKFLRLRVGVVPLPVALIVVLLCWYFARKGSVPNEVCMMMAVIATGGFICAEIGKRIPLLRHIGGAAICAAFIPSAMVYYGWLPVGISKPITDFTKSTVFLYLFITAIIVGSILGMDRRTLVRGFVKIFVPLGAGSLLALIVGSGVGSMLGLGLRHTLLFIVIPVMAGGVGEGAIPLSTGYAPLLHQSQGDLFARVLPAVMFGNLVAITISGILNQVGKRRPSLTGNGQLQPGASEQLAVPDEQPEIISLDNIAAAGLLAISLYLLGLWVKDAWDFPAPVTMLFLAVALKLSGIVPAELLRGAHVVYKFFRIAVTYPLLFAIAVAMTPWDKLIAGFAWQNLLTITATVTTLMMTGFYVGRWIKLYPIEAAIVNGCHSGQGGTGDVAILTAANRMQLMPFAQIATRIGGAITVTVTLILLRMLE